MERAAFLEIEDGGSSYYKTLVPIFQFVQHHIPEDHSLKIHDPFQEFRSRLHVTCYETTSHPCDKRISCQKATVVKCMELHVFI